MENDYKFQSPEHSEWSIELIIEILRYVQNDDQKFGNRVVAGFHACFKMLNGGWKMKFYMKQKVMSFVDKFTIYDEHENEAYWVEGDFFTIGKKLDLFDNNNNHKAHIHQKVLSFLPRYFIEINGEDVAEVVKHITLFKQKFTVTGYDWEVEGDFLAHEYEIYHGDYTIATISKEWFTWGDAYAVDITDGVDPVPILSVVLIIDAILAQNNAKISFVIGS